MVPIPERRLSVPVQDSMLGNIYITSIEHVLTLGAHSEHGFVLSIANLSYLVWCLPVPC